jgi:glycerol-3-phosphate dehydrogenase
MMEVESVHDIVIIGAGVTGCAIARELSRYELDIVVLEKGPDVAYGCSRANSGIVHAGYDAKPGTQKAKYNMLGRLMFDELCCELDFPFRRCGALVVAFDPEGLPELERLKAQGEKNGLDDLSILDQKRLRQMERNISPDACAALWAPSSGIASPYEMTVALAENAAENGVSFRLNCRVDSVSRQKDGFLIQTGDGALHSRVLINAAGCHADTINNQLSQQKYEIVPRRGEYCLLDRTEGFLVRSTIFQLPTRMGKGVLVTPTADGNTLLGPTSMDISDKDDTATTAGGLAEVMEKAGLSVKSVPRDKIITSFAGLRPHCATTNDFIIGPADDVPGLLNALGIESPGLTAAPAIAKEIGRHVAEMLRPEPNRNFNPVRKAPPRFRQMTNDERAALIAGNPDYGQVICRCETVTKGEILDVLRSPLGVRDLDAVKRRTRAGMGRCQGGFCWMRMLDIIAEELRIPVTAVCKNEPGTNLLVSPNKALAEVEK